jgi:hypothetical protein
VRETLRWWPGPGPGILRVLEDFPKSAVEPGEGFGISSAARMEGVELENPPNQTARRLQRLPSVGAEALRHSIPSVRA